MNAMVTETDATNCFRNKVCSLKSRQESSGLTRPQSLLVLRNRARRCAESNGKAKEKFSGFRLPKMQHKRFSWPLIYKCNLIWVQLRDCGGVSLRGSKTETTRKGIHARISHIRCLISKKPNGSKSKGVSMIHCVNGLARFNNVCIARQLKKSESVYIMNWKIVQARSIFNVARKNKRHANLPKTKADSP